MALRTFARTHKPGYATAVFKAKQSGQKAIAIPAGRWTPLFRWNPGDVDLGPTALEVEMYGSPVSCRKQGRWVRLNDPADHDDDDVTKRTGLVASTIEPLAWAGIHMGIEDIGPADLPLEFRFLATRNMTLHTVVGKAMRGGGG
jgi:hypothetical protein